MLKATEDEIEEVREYFEWQALDLEVTFMQKVCSEAVLNTRHDVWDVHTNKDRWWVITGGTNLYSQEQFPSMDLALTFHIGLILRIPRTEEQQEDDLRILPFGPVFEKMEEAGTAVTQAQNLADYQAVGVRCREALLELIGVAQDAAVWTDKPPQRANWNRAKIPRHPAYSGNDRAALTADGPAGPSQSSTSRMDSPSSLAKVKNPTSAAS